MIEGVSPVTGALLGTLFTWGLTAVGAACVFLMPSDAKMSQTILDTMLGFAAGVMVAASFWSLLAPAIDIAQQNPTYGENGEYAFFPAAVGFSLGGASMLANFDEFDPKNDDEVLATLKEKSWRRVLLLVIAITLHNFPEGMAVGVGFGSVGKSPEATLGSARNLAIGIGLQNFPEGLAVSMPLRREGFSLFQCFWWGQLSGLVEPLGGVIGAYAVTWVEPILPYALSYAAGAMIWVVADELIPEAHQGPNSKLCSVGVMVGFVTMMVMDVALG